MGSGSSGDLFFSARLFCYRLRKRAYRNRYLVSGIALAVAAYVVLNELYACRVIFTQECFQNNDTDNDNNDDDNKNCLQRVWERYAHSLSEEDAKHLHVHKSARCSKELRLGHWIQDGGWNICADDFPPPTSTNANNRCIVYSFGISDDPSFDIDLVRRWPHCTVYAFDPSIGRRTGDGFLGPNIEFYSIGLGGWNVSSQDDKRGWEIMTLDSIMDMLHHDRVDLLKMDIEGSEWATWLSWKDSRVHEKIGHLVGEIHFSKKSRTKNIKQVKVLGLLLHRFGFGVFHRNDNFRYSGLMDVAYSGDTDKRNEEEYSVVRTYSCMELGWKRLG